MVFIFLGVGFAPYSNIKGYYDDLLFLFVCFLNWIFKIITLNNQGMYTHFYESYFPKNNKIRSDVSKSMKYILLNWSLPVYSCVHPKY